jgi:hypothetical protein
LERYDLVIIGGGAPGINALKAAVTLAAWWFSSRVNPEKDLGKVSAFTCCWAIVGQYRESADAFERAKALLPAYFDSRPRQREAFEASRGR